MRIGKDKADEEWGEERIRCMSYEDRKGVDENDVKVDVEVNVEVHVEVNVEVDVEVNFEVNVEVNVEVYLMH